MAASRAKSIMAAALLFAAVPLPMASRAAPSLDFDFFKARVQPIFLQKRPGHARCIQCHETGQPRLQALAADAQMWTEEQSRQNFTTWSRLVVPGNPNVSKLLVHPLAETAGGDFYHSGGKHWTSQNDPEWLLMKKWVFGETAK